MIVTATIDEELKQVEWDVEGGKKMPPVLSISLASFRFFDLKKHTYSCLELAINLIKDSSESLRPDKEI